MIKYFSFNDKSTRKEFWQIVAFNVLATASLFFAAMLIGDKIPLLTVSIVMLTTITSLLLSLATSVRRCRDADISPWWTAVTVFPYVGLIAMIVIGSIKSSSK